MYSNDDIRTGRITAVTPQKKDPNRVSVFVDNEFAFGVSLDVAVRLGLAKGTVVDEGRIEKALQADGVSRAFNAALHLLGFRTRTVEEIRRRLIRKGFEEEAVEEVLQRLHELSYVDDRAYAVEYATARVRTRGEGLYRIRADLRRRGVGEGIIDEVLHGLEDDVDWAQVAREIADKRWSQLAATKDERRRRKKLFDYLVRKGFDFSTARAVSSEIES